VLYRAIKEDLFPQDKNPFFRFKLKSAKTKKAKLDEEEVKRLEDLELTEGSTLWHVKNYWLFSFYCYGVRFSDMATLKWTNIHKDRLQYSMNKTGNSTDLQMRSVALKIIELYKYRKTKKSTNGFVFPILDDGFDYSDVFFLKRKISSCNAKLNKSLKTVAEKAKIDKPLSFHIARHTFSDIARKKNVNLYTVSKALNHSSLKITENYLNSLDTDSVDRELRQALGE
jgi:integrase